MASFEFEDITGRGNHPEVQLDELAAVPMTQATVESLVTEVDSLLEDIAFRPREYPLSSDYQARECEFSSEGQSSDTLCV